MLLFISNSFSSITWHHWKWPKGSCELSWHFESWRNLLNLDLYSLSGQRSHGRSREVSKPKDWMLQWSHRSENWQASRQRCCRVACQISERLEKSKPESRGFETSRDLAYSKTSAHLVNGGSDQNRKHPMCIMRILITWRWWNCPGLRNWNRSRGQLGWPAVSDNVSFPY